MTVGQGSPHVCHFRLSSVSHLQMRLGASVARLRCIFALVAFAFASLCSGFVAAQQIPPNTSINPNSNSANAALPAAGQASPTTPATQAPEPPRSPNSTDTSAGTSAGTLSTGERLAFELRMVWGGEASRGYSGSISIDDGRLKLVRNLSLQADSIGAISNVNAATLKVAGHSPSTFGGADVGIEGSPASRLTIRFDHPATGQPVEHSFTLSEVLEQRWFRNIDEQGGRVAVERQMQDRVRLRPSQAKSIFPVGTNWMGTVAGYRCGLAAGDYQLSTKLLDPSNQDAIVSEQVMQVTVDAKGDFSSPSLEIALPQVEGAYSIEFSLQRKRFLQSFVSTSDPLTRRLDLVVFDHQAKPNRIEYWAPVATIQPLNSQWWSALNWFSTLGQSQPLIPLPAFADRTKRLVNHGPQGTRKVGELDCLTLGPNAWQAYPLTIEHPGKPHRLRVRVPRDRAQQLVVSVRDFHETGEPTSMNVDSGIVITERQIASQLIGAGLWADHEIVFWPRSPQPYLMMMNGSEKTEACFGELQLEVAEIQAFSPDSSATKEPPAVTIAPAKLPAEAQGNSRMVALYLSKPLLADTFGASRNVDPITRRPLESWSTWQQSAVRLTQFMMNSGYNTLILSTVGDGGSIIPIQRLGATPRFDNGAFFSDGRSPEPKDFIELLSCHFDRCGLKLILSMDISCHLPALAKAEADSAKIANLYQVNLDGQKWQLDSDQSRRSVLYNPLNDQVQTELEQIVREVSQRYASHRSFCGLTLELKEASHFAFAGDRWGYDEATLQKYEAAVQSKLPSRDMLTSAMQGGLRLAFLNWRARELSSFYVRLADTIRSAKPDAKLLINPLAIWQQPPSQYAYSDPIAITRNLSDTLLAAGVDVPWLSRHAHVTVMRAQFDSPFEDEVDRGWQSRVSYDSSLQFLNAGNTAGNLALQRPSALPIPEASKLRAVNTPTSAGWCYPTVSTLGAEVRKRTIEALYHEDTMLVADGSWMPIQCDSLQLNQFRRSILELPATPMRSVKVDGGDSNFRLRSLKVGNDTYLQMINNASWTERVTMDMKIADIPGIFEVLGGRELTIHGAATSAASSSRVEADGKRASTIWQFDLPPYDMLAFKISDPQFKLNNLIHSADPSLIDHLKQDIEALEAQLAQISDSARAEPLGLRGGDFEKWVDGGRPLGWTLSSLPYTTISPENSLPRSGTTCVAIENKNQAKVSAWLQSEQIHIPASGRVVISAWVRSPSVGNQPQTMRLSLIGRLRDGRRYQRSLQFGATGGAAAGSNVNAPASYPSNSSAGSNATTGINNGAGSFANQSNSEIAVDWGRRPVTLYVTDLPSDELTELYVAFDLVGPGKVWIDDVQAFEAYLNPDERVQIRSQLFLAKEKLRENNPFPAEQVLNSHLARYIQSVIPLAGQTTSPAKKLMVNPESRQGNNTSGSSAYGSSSKSTPRPPLNSPENSSDKPAINDNWNNPQPVLKQLRQSMRERWQR